MSPVNKVAIVLVVGIIAVFIGIAFTMQGIQEESVSAPTTDVSIANPASVYCTEQGGTLTLVSTEEGVIGECELADGTICEEWEYFRGECGEPAESTTEVTTANPASVYCTEQGGTLTLVSTEEGVIGECELADGTICEEWEYFRGECG